VSSVVERVLDLCDRVDPGTVRGLYLYGSSIVGGLRPDSDLDLLLVTGASLEPDERHQLTDLLLDYADERARAEAGRPVELTSVVHSSLVPWSYPLACDYQYGEWLVDEFRDGAVPQPHADPDLTIVLAAARPSSEPLRGPRLDELIPLVPAADVRRAIHDSLPALLGDLLGDERNVLLTLARMIVTLESDDIVPKDEAARRIAVQLAPSDAAVLDLARLAYLGQAVDDWTMLAGQARATADQLATRVETIYRRTLKM
jgi:aminoglycoside 9-adenylyltransferase